MHLVAVKLQYVKHYQYQIVEIHHIIHSPYYWKRGTLRRQSNFNRLGPHRQTESAGSNRMVSILSESVNANTHR